MTRSEDGFPAVARPARDPAHAESLKARAARILAAPTAPFREDAVLARIDQELAAIPGAIVHVDAWGNRIVQFGTPDPRQSIPLFVAHTDHPGFLLKPGPLGTVHEAVFEGLVDDAWFPDSPVRIFGENSGGGTSGRVRSASTYSPVTDRREIILLSDEPIPGGALAMWDLPALEIDGDTIRGRALDDLFAVTVLLEAMHRMAGAASPPRPFAAIFTRGEEAGFCGLLCLLNDPEAQKYLPAHYTAISLEISGERGEVSPGTGVVIRLGDKATTFDSEAVRVIESVAAATPGLRWKRALMDAGTCEASAFAERGVPAAGLCIPLRHYHNMNRRTGRLACEEVSLSDGLDYLELVVAIMQNGLGSLETTSAKTRQLKYATWLQKGRAMLGAGAASGPSAVSSGNRNGV